VPSASRLAADALALSRLVLAGVLALVLPHAPAHPVVPAVVFALAAASDYVDGPLARRAGGATRHGAILDSLADVAFVLAGTVTGAVLGLVPAAVPLAIARSFSLYALASVSARWGTARTMVGHRAGVANYALTGLVTGAVAFPGVIVPRMLEGASLVVIAINLAAVLERLWAARRGRARAPHAAGTLARSRRSSA
jgi:CDP-diacylglycerol---glycerol-3-phosphate 3-phosphatidyltransferase